MSRVMRRTIQMFRGPRRCLWEGALGVTSRGTSSVRSVTSRTDGYRWLCPKEFINRLHDKKQVTLSMTLVVRPDSIAP